MTTSPAAAPSCNSSRVSSRASSRASSRSSSGDGVVTTTPFAAKYPTQFTPPRTLSPALSPTNLECVDEENLLIDSQRLTYQVSFFGRRIFTVPLTQRERRILQAELETYNMQLISLQIGTAPLSCYANPEDRNILYSNARKTTFPAKFAMSVANEGTELGYSKEEIASIFNAKWNAKETPPCLGYGMLPLTSRIATEGVGL